MTRYSGDGESSAFSRPSELYTAILGSTSSSTFLWYARERSQIVTSNLHMKHLGKMSEIFRTKPARMRPNTKNSAGIDLVVAID